MFYRLPVTRADWTNVVETLATLWLLTAVVFALYLDGRVSYTSEGFYIRSLGWRSLVGLAKEHFVSFDDSGGASQDSSSR